MFNFFNKTKSILINTDVVNSDSIIELHDSLDLLDATTTNVTETAINTTKFLKEQLYQSANRFFKTIDAVDDVIIIKDGNNKWLTLNIAGQKVFGLGINDYYGKTNQEIALEHPHLLKSLRFNEDTDNFAWDLGSPYRFDEIIPSHDNINEVLYFDVVKTPTFLENKKRKELIVIARNVTEARNHIRRQRACFLALNSISDGIVILDKNENIFFANDTFLAAFVAKWSKMDEVVGKKIPDIINDFCSYPNMWETIKQNKSWSNDENKKYKVFAVPMMNGLPEPVFYICTFKSAPQITDDIRKNQHDIYNTPLLTTNYNY